MFTKTDTVTGKSYGLSSTDRHPTFHLGTNFIAILPILFLFALQILLDYWIPAIPRA